jgi:flagellar biosynthesis component FlhA
VPDLAARLRLGRLVRALLRDGMSIVPWREIVEGIADTSKDVEGQVGAIRAARRASLPGNEPTRRREPAPPDLEQGLSELVERRDGEIVAAPEMALEMAEQIRDFVRSLPPFSSVVVKSSAVRSFLQSLIGPSFPPIPVLAQDELVEAAPAVRAPSGAQVLGAANGQSQPRPGVDRVD